MIRLDSAGIWRDCMEIPPNLSLFCRTRPKSDRIWPDSPEIRPSSVEFLPRRRRERHLCKTAVKDSRDWHPRQTVVKDTRVRFVLLRVGAPGARCQRHLSAHASARAFARACARGSRGVKLLPWPRHGSWTRPLIVRGFACFDVYHHHYHPSHTHHTRTIYRFTS